MVVVKGKLNTYKSRVSQDHSTNKNDGVINFKVYTENDKSKSGNPDTVDIESKRKSTPVNSRIIQGGLKTLEKSNVKRDGFVTRNVGRKVLTDISNVGANIPRNKLGDDASKAVAFMSSDTTSACSSLSMPLKVKVRANMNQAIGGYHALKRAVVTKDFKNSSHDMKSKFQGCKFVSAAGRTSGQNPPPPMRKSLPVLKPVDHASINELKILDNAETSERREGKYGFPVKPRTGRNVIPQVRNPQNPLWRNRVSDGFIIMASESHAKADSRVLLRKPVKPTSKNMVRVSSTQRMSKSKCTSVWNKSTSIAATSSKKEEEVAMASLLKCSASAVLDEQLAQEELSSESNNIGTTSSDINARRKSCCRKSFTSFLMAKSKILEEHAEIRQWDDLPNIYDDCNHLEVPAYVDDIYQYYWVMEVHLKFNLMQETLFLVVTLLDRYLSLVSIKKCDMQLVGLTALLLASKYEDFWHPRILDLVSISAESYTRDQILVMEITILKKLKFRLNTPTPYVFMLRFLKAAQSDIKFEHLAFYLVELCMVEYEALKFKPSLLCASAIYVARCTLQMTPSWTPLLAKHARYEVSQIRDCAEMILRFHKVAKTAMLKVTYEKYMRLDYSGVAALKPLNRLPL